MLGVIVDSKNKGIGHKMANDVLKYVVDELENVVEWAENNDVYWLMYFKYFIEIKIRVFASFYLVIRYEKMLGWTSCPRFRRGCSFRARILFWNLPALWCVP